MLHIFKIYHKKKVFRIFIKLLKKNYTQIIDTFLSFNIKA